MSAIWGHPDDWTPITREHLKINALGVVKVSDFLQGNPLHGTTIGTVSTTGEPVWVLNVYDEKWGGSADTFDHAKNELAAAAMDALTQRWHEEQRWTA